MDCSEIYDFLNQNPVVYLATCEGTKPHVRGMLLYRTDKHGIIFHTGKIKDLDQQLEHNPAVEFCAFSPKENKQVRVFGTAERVEGDAIKQEIVKNRPFMKPWVEQRGLGLLTVWRIKDCRAIVWTMEANFDPKEYIKI